MPLETKGFEFEDFFLDLKERVLLRDGKPVGITPKTFQLLNLLIENHGHIVEKVEIMRKVWSDSFVEDSNLTFSISQLRKILGDDKNNPRFIETIPRRGYRFLGKVNEISENKQIIELDENSSSSYSNYSYKYQYSQLFSVLAVILILTSVVMAVWFAITYSNRIEAQAPILSSQLKFEAISLTGQTFFSKLSPNGKFVAYIKETNKKHSLWLKNLENSTNTEILPPSDDVYQGLTFSNKNDFIYFVRQDFNGNLHPSTIYRVSLLGGIPEKLIQNAEGWIDISPDDTKIVFSRYYKQEQNRNALLIADADGKNERELASRLRPNNFTRPVFSPDGATIAVSVGNSDSGAKEQSLVEIDVENGKERQITQRKFYVISGISWLPNKSGLVFTASEDFSLPQKIWKLSYQTGEVEQLVNDAGSYSKVSLDKEAKQMIVNQVSSDFRLFVGNFANPKDLESLSSAFDKSEFISGDRIIYPNFMNGQGDIWMMNYDGSAQKQLTNDPASDARIIISPDERFIFFTSNRTGSHQIWRINFDGSNQKQITTKEGGFPIFVTPDGNTLYYWSSFNRNLWKIPSDGGEESLVFDQKMHQPSISSDGKHLSFLFREANSHKIAVVSIEDFQTKYTFSPLNSDSNLVCLKWANDNQSFYYVSLDKDKNYRLWQQSLLAQKPSEITNFGDAEVSDFSISLDNKKFAVIRGEWKHNTVLIRASK